MAPPKGHIKKGGRKKGTVNRITTNYKTLISNSCPIEFLITAFTTGKVPNTTDILTLKERCDIAKDLAKKIVPDMKSIEYVDENGKKISPNITVRFVESNKASDVTIGGKVCK